LATRNKKCSKNKNVKKCVFIQIIKNRKKCVLHLWVKLVTFP